MQSRQILAQQLAISRDLTKKLTVANDTDSEGEQENNPVQEDNMKKPTDLNNPWIKTEEEIDNFIQSYRKYWDEHNKQKEIAQNVVTDVEFAKQEENDQVKDLKDMQDPQEGKSQPEIQKTVTKKSKSTKRKLTDSFKNNNKKKSKQSTEWIVTNIDDETALENLFDNLEETLDTKIKKKSRKLLKTKTVKQKKVGNKLQEKKTKKIDLNIPKPVTRPIIDEKLIESVGDHTDETNKELEVLQNILKTTSEPKASKKPVISENIDPEKAINIKPISLNTEIPELLTVDDENDSDGNDQNLADIAFEDDDVLEEFSKEKSDAIEKSKPKDIDLTLPGWGSWGGKNLQVPKKKRKKYIIKFPKEVKRKDMNKGLVIINEDGYDKARQHQVSEVPFPFKTVKDFEASIRAPIGSTFVPEVPHRKFILPPVRTKMGTIIEPMSEEILLKKALKGLPIVK